MKTKTIFLYLYRTVLGVIGFFSWARIETTVENDNWGRSALVAFVCIFLFAASFKKIRKQFSKADGTIDQKN